MTPISKRICVAAIVAALSTTPMTAMAHAYLTDSFPARSQHIDRAPSKIRLTFTGKTEAHFSTVRLKDERGAVLAEVTPQQASREIVMPAPSLAPGQYQVDYRVLSADGDVVQGAVGFTVDD